MCGGLATVNLEAITDETEGLTHLLRMGCCDDLQVLKPIQRLAFKDKRHGEGLTRLLFHLPVKAKRTDICSEGGFSDV